MEVFSIPLVLLFVAPIVSLVVGIVLMRRALWHELAGMAAAFTLKPLLTTPLWLWIWFGLAGLAEALPGVFVVSALSVLPAIAITLAIAWMNQGLLFDLGPYRSAARSLLVFDCVRWLNSALLVVLGVLNNEGLLMTLAVVGLALPILYAFTALALCSGSRQP